MNATAPTIYAFLHARLGALRAELLTGRHWEKLLSATRFEEQRQILSATAYASWLPATPERALRGIKNAIHSTARKIEHSLPPRAARFIRMWGRRDQLRNLKAILKGKALERSDEDIRAELLDLDRRYALPTDRLLRCANVEAALDLLEDTDLRHWIRAARQIYQREPTLFGLDAALERLYYVELWQHLEQLAPPDRATVEELMALELDQVNLLWLLRYRLNYHLSPAETYYLLLPVTGRITADQLKGLVRHESLEAITAAIAVGPLREILASCESIGQVEVVLRRYRGQHAHGMLARAGFTLGEALALLILKGIEARDLIALLEGTRLGATRRDIEEQLAGVRHD